jgi:hypothetical protein
MYGVDVSAAAIGFCCAAVIRAQAVVGLAGFYLHTEANLEGPSTSLFDNFVYGAPAMAPLLFPNLALLTLIGLWVWNRIIIEPALARP